MRRPAEFVIRSTSVTPPLSLHLHINSVSWNVVRRTQGSNMRTRPSNRKHDKNATNCARPSNEGQRTVGDARMKSDRNRLTSCQRNSQPGSRPSRHARPKQQQQASCFQRRQRSSCLFVWNSRCYFRGGGFQRGSCSWRGGGRGGQAITSRGRRDKKLRWMI